MKLFKIIIFLIIIISIFITLNLFLSRQINPISKENDFYTKIDNAFQTSQLEPTNLTIKDYLNQVEFYLQTEDNHYTKVIVSTKKDPYWQISSLQDFLKTAKINNKQINLIDLSIDHPYATFKNN